ncbi:MAG: AAA family ATPase [Saprospiraceae bacterium]
MENTTTISPPIPIQRRVKALLGYLQTGLYEREQAMALALLAALAGESIFLLGPPGVAKSMIARRLKYAFQGGQSFEYLMNRFSTPDEVFGPVSISKLRLEDKYERQTHRYLPGAQIVFLDEIWKAGPAIQNALLTVINEKVYRNGEQEVRVELRGLIAASNELPEKGQGLDALWDRFLIRLKVDNIREEQNFFRMITENGAADDDPVPEDLKITPEELREWSGQIDAVEVPDEVLKAIGAIRSQLDHTAPLVSDRRWKKIIRLLRTAAFTEGRKAVELIDCYLIPDCLWNNAEQLPAITSRADFMVSNQPIGDIYATDHLVNELHDEVSYHTVRVTEGVKKEMKVHVLSDGQRYYLVHLPNKMKYYIPEQDFNGLQFDQTVTLGLTYLYQKQLRVFPNAQLRLTRTPYVLIVGDEVGRIDTFEQTTEIREYVQPAPEVMRRLEAMADDLLEQERARLDKLDYLEATLPIAIEAYPYLQERESIWNHFPRTRATLNKRLMHIAQVKHALYPPEVSTENDSPPALIL